MEFDKGKKKCVECVVEENITKEVDRDKGKMLIFQLVDLLSKFLGPVVRKAFNLNGV
jgi:hypothetical protein